MCVVVAQKRSCFLWGAAAKVESTEHNVTLIVCSRLADGCVVLLPLFLLFAKTAFDYAAMWFLWNCVHPFNETPWSRGSVGRSGCKAKRSGGMCRMEGCWMRDECWRYQEVEEQTHQPCVWRLHDFTLCLAAPGLGTNTWYDEVKLGQLHLILWSVLKNWTRLLDERQNISRKQVQLTRTFYCKMAWMTENLHRRLLRPRSSQERLLTGSEGRIEATEAIVIECHVLETRRHHQRPRWDQ